MKKNEIFWLPTSSLSLESDHDNARLRNHRRIRRRWAPRVLVSIERFVAVFTALIAGLVLCNFYRVALGIRDLDDQQKQQQQQLTTAAADDADKPKRQLPGIDHNGSWQTLLQRGRLKAHGPAAWIEEMQRNYAIGVDNSELETSGTPRDPDERRFEEEEESPRIHEKVHDRVDPAVVYGDGDRRMCGGFDNSIRRPKHGCQVNEDTGIVFCNFDDLRVDVSKIDMAAGGGEELSDVMGRDEEDEFPTFRKGAFVTPTKPEFEVPTEYRTRLHYLENVLNALRYPTKRNKNRLELDCQETYPGTTLFLTRYEYVNLYHTLTDWWNTYFVLPRRTKPGAGSTHRHNDGIVRPDRIVFLDGHAKGMLDPEWQTLFGPYNFIEHLGKGVDGGICFERAIFVPPGYKSTLFNQNYQQTCPDPDMGRDFSDFVLDRHGLLSTTEVVPGSVVIVDRQPFVAHPRSDPNGIARGFEPSFLDALERRLRNIPGVATIRRVRLETVPFGEQLRLLRETQVLIGVHGAAFSHLMFMDERRSHVLEFRDYIQSDLFEDLSRWKGIDHRYIEYSGSLDEYQIREAADVVASYWA